MVFKVRSSVKAPVKKVSMGNAATDEEHTMSTPHTKEAWAQSLSSVHADISEPRFACTALREFFVPSIVRRATVSTRSRAACDASAETSDDMEPERAGPLGGGQAWASSIKIC
jgi:hypothetical protein